MLAQAEQPPRNDAPVRQPHRWSDLRTRVLSAAVMIPLALGCAWVGGAAFAVMVALISVGMAYEWLRMCRAPLDPRSVLMFASLPLAVLLTTLGAAAGALVLLAVVAVVATARRRPRSSPHCATDAGDQRATEDATTSGANGATPAAADLRVGTRGPGRLLPLGVLYIGPAAIALVWLRGASDHGFAEVIILLLVIWATDIGAYAVGRAIGGPRLAPRISPGKTWSGSAGGLLAGMAVGVAAAFVLGLGIAGWQAALLAGVIGSVGQAGDLLESLLKRRFDVKDSGHLIPGHGGLLDRLDAVLTAAPAAALLALLLGGGVLRWQ